MPTYISHKGKWYAAKERIALKNKGKNSFEYKGETIEPGDDFIYKGADREALKELHNAGQEYFGRDFRTEPEFLQSIRTQGFQTVDAYLKHIGYDEEADDKKFKEKAEVVNRHELPQRVKEIKVMGGGSDTSDGKQSHVGGFGEERLRNAEEIGK